MSVCFNDQMFMFNKNIFSNAIGYVYSEKVMFMEFFIFLNKLVF